MSNKEKQGFFRRIRSPLEHRTTSRQHEEKQRSSSTSVIPVQQSNGHQRHGSDDVVKIENTAYGDPDILNSNRSYSTGTSPGDILNPPLPPRNPPKQLVVGLHLQQSTSSPSNTSGNMNDESPVYVAPADTLQRGGGGGAGPNSLSKGVLSSNYTRAEPLSAPPSKNERKVMEMHQLTMSQRQRQDTGQSAAHAHQQQRVQVQNVVDNSEYSTPFNLIQQQQQKMANKGVSGKGSSGSTRQQRRVPQIGMAEENDQIIPVLSPPPGHSDRSQTTSPSSPLSTPSSEHEEGGTGGGGSVGGTGDSDYDIPWDRKFRDLQLINRPPNTKRQSSGGKIHYPDDGKEFHPHPGSRGGRRESPPQRNVYPRGYSDRSSPPAPPERNPPSSYQSKGRRMSPQPPEDLLLSRPPASRYMPSRHQSEQHRPRDGSTSPNQMVGRYGGHTIHGPHVPRDLPPEISPRTSSMSASHMSGRRLPSPPRERSESSPVDRRGVLRPPSPPNPVHIDFSIPLCDQP